VALTADASNGAATASVEAGGDEHMTKPVERTDLIDAIAKFAERPAPPEERISDLIMARRPAFLENRQLDLEKMRVALVAQEFAVIQKIGHNCKGVGKGYGFPQISEIGASIEKAAKTLDANLVLQSIDDFESYLKVARQEVAA
jgi:hypothetical protein